jgi:hypothetical protein
MVTKRLSATALGAALLFAPFPAHAGDVAVAEALYREGLRLMDAQDYAAACPKLAESQRQDPATGTLLALAMCQERLGKTATAWANYTLVATESKSAGRADREAVARERRAALEPRLSKLTIEVSPDAATEDLSLRRDDVAIGRGAWGVPVPVDPGKHVITASAPGKQQWSTTVELGAAADLQTVRVPALEAAAAPDAAGPDAAPEVDGDAADEGGGSPLPIIGLGVGGAGILALGIGTFFGLRAKSLNDESNETGRCTDNLCSPEGGDKRDDALTAADVATVSFIAGGVLVATGATLYILGSAEDEGEARVEARPEVGVGSAGLRVVGSF